MSKWSKQSLKSGVHTCFLFPTERQALLCEADCVDVDQVLSVWSESGQSEVVPGGGQTLILGSPTTGHLVTDAVTSDFALGSEPVDGKRVGQDLREA